jgi:hypothetical protein
MALQLVLQLHFQSIFILPNALASKEHQTDFALWCIFSGQTVKMQYVLGRVNDPLKYNYGNQGKRKKY